MENDINNKPKKINKKKLGINLLTIITLASGIFLIASIFMISGIENTLRYVAMAVIFIINILLVLLISKFLNKEKKSKIVIAIVISLLMIIIQSFIGYFVIKTYTSLDSMNKEKITYTTVIAVKSDSKFESLDDLDKKKIGIVVDETSIDGYVIGLEIIDDENLEDESEVVEYTDFSTLVKDLYDGKIDAMIIGKNYPSMFKTVDDYKNIGTDTKIIYEKSKTLTKDEIAK